MILNVLDTSLLSYCIIDYRVTLYSLRIMSIFKVIRENPSYKRNKETLICVAYDSNMGYWSQFIFASICFEMSGMDIYLV